jgi:hypothetical protein
MERFSSLNSLFHHHQQKKNRQQCDIELTVESLVDVPLVYGQLYASIKLRNSANDLKISSPLYGLMTARSTPSFIINTSQGFRQRSFSAVGLSMERENLLSAE